MSDTKALGFLIGNFDLFLNKQMLELTRPDNRLLDFVEMFNDVNDRYLAHTLFEEKPELEIARVSDDFFDEFVVPHIYDLSIPLYNLYVKSDPSFFVESFAELDYLMHLCEYFGFNYSLHGTETNRQL